MKRAVRLMIVVFIIALFAACAPIPPSAENAAPDAADNMADDVATLVYYGSFGGLIENETEVAQSCADQIGINLEVAEVAGGVAELMTELRALNTAGDMPDVFWMSSGFVDEFAADGLLLNMQPLVDENINPDDYFAAAFAAGRSPNKVDSDMYAFPLRFVETILYYNIDAFDAAGVDYPTADWTWDDFLTAAQALTFDENGDGLMDQYGYYFFGRYAHIESWVYQNGGRFLNEDRTAFEPDANALEALMFLDSLIDDHGVAPQPAEMDGIDNPFGAGIAAMWIDGSWNIGNFPDLNIEVAQVPSGPNGDGDTAYGWSDMVSISADTDHPVESFALVQCLSENWTADMAGGGIPAFRTTAFSDAWAKPDQAPPTRTVLLDWADNVGPTTFTPGWGEWRGYVGGAGLQGQLGEAFNGNITIEEAVDATSTVANDVLNRYYGE
ncbi:MAG: extracellular solute-binding protein [Chloroflexota bacterium]